MSASKPLIAIVDDDEYVCRAMKRLVRSLGMEADEFTSGEEFIKVLEAMPWLKIDCVVLDVQMPNVNGLEVQERLARIRNHIPIIFMTAHDEATIRQRALAAGAAAFLRKPFKDDLFVETLRKALKPGTDGEQGQGAP
jgi:FixJ family two-component response regulator